MLLFNAVSTLKLKDKNDYFLYFSQDRDIFISYFLEFKPKT